MSVLCELCGHSVDYENGGAALLIAFCHDHGTTMSNMSYCGKCFDETIRKPLARLSEAAKLNIPLSEEGDED